MAKKRETDRHITPKMTLRIPQEQGQALKALAAAEDRTVTTVILRALRAYAESNGHAWPGTGRGNGREK